MNEHFSFSVVEVQLVTFGYFKLSCNIYRTHA